MNKYYNKLKHILIDVGYYSQISKYNYQQYIDICNGYKQKGMEYIFKPIYKKKKGSLQLSHFVFNVNIYLNFKPTQKFYLDIYDELIPESISDIQSILDAGKNIMLEINKNSYIEIIKYLKNKNKK